MLILALLLAASVASAPATGGGRDARVTAELGRLEARLAEIAPALPKEFEGGKDAQAPLDRARHANGADYRLYRLRDAFVSVEALAFVAANKSAAESLDRFGALWASQRPQFQATPPTPRGSVLERALVESASARAAQLFAASRSYAKVSSPLFGLYYLGEAEANLRFGEFVAKNSTKVASGERSSTRARMASSLDALEQAMLVLFNGDVTSPNAMPVSARLKEARELLAAGRIDGAALLAIEARLTMTRRGGPKGQYAPATVDPSTSIASLLASWAADEQPPMSEAIRSEVVPFWGSLLLPSQKTTKVPALVTVTLVRWPFT